MTLVRVQRKRTKDWRMPNNTIHVGHGTKWANPYRVGRKYPRITLAVLKKDGAKLVLGDLQRIDSRLEATCEFRWLLNPTINLDGLPNYPTIEEIRSQLAGKNLACYCPLDESCHADVLLEIANQNPTNKESK